MKSKVKTSEVSPDLQKLLHKEGNPLSIKKDTFLFNEGEPASRLFMVTSGKVQIGKLSPDGKELALRICHAGDIIGEVNLYSEEVKYILHAKVLEDGEVIVLDKAKLEESLLQEKELTIEFMKLMNNSYRRDQTRFRDLVLFGKKGALYSTLIRLSNSYGVKTNQDIYLDISLTNQQLANFCGTTRESVNRLLNELKRNSVISMDKGHITIHDLNFLKSEINCEDCPIVLCTIH
ncbi:Crp/Fnr family transcriptional regulator [Virgibacillus halodenitrificans]|uniref:Crp/Fnr family transcriptional regulator n=1 Tax=Virgibacillus halodenitrificans TaxID=1482 RepID=UPI000EF5303F|nr:Crp/Fnr family transcriptional regulator [Virgibacillus halodenitrificans]